MITIKKLNSYYRRALTIAEDSHDPDTKVAALLVNSESGAVIADGYNGFVRGADDENLPKTRPEKYQYFLHSEINMICNAARNGINTSNCIVFCTLSPCAHCLRVLYQSGITEIYFKDRYRDFDKDLILKDLNIIVTSIGEFSKIALTANKLGNS
jgi:dCMP deaminase